MGIFDIFKRKSINDNQGEEVSEEMAKQTKAVDQNFDNSEDSAQEGNKSVGKKKMSDVELGIEVLKDRGYLSQVDIDRKREELGK